MILRRLILFLLLPGIAVAQLTDLRLPISLDAESTDYDGKNSMLMFRGLRLTQGNIGIEADEGRASKLDFQDSVWRFTGNVIIDVENGHIECESADLQFHNHRLKFATITGAPATFEMKRPGSGEVTYAEAGSLHYNLDAGIIEFSDEATITEGGNQISSSLLVYNIQDQRITAQSNGDGDGRVKITYTPPTAEESNEAQAADGEDPGDQQPPAVDTPVSGPTEIPEQPQSSPADTAEDAPQPSQAGETGAPEPGQPSDADVPDSGEGIR